MLLKNIFYFNFALFKVLNIIRKKRILVKLIYYLLIIFSAWKINYSNAQKNNKIVEILGNKRINTNTILYYSGLKKNEKIDKKKANKAMKKLYFSGYFSEVCIAVTNKKVKIKVNENPYIKKIYIKGNKRIKTRQIIEVIDIAKNKSYSKFYLNADIKRIKLIYRKIGCFFVKVHLKIAINNNGWVNMHFTIDENKKAKIQKILFLGNNEFSGKILNKVLLTKESLRKKFSNNYLTNQIIMDVKLLRNFYIHHGFINFKVLSFSIKTIKKLNSIAIYYIFSEGKKYKIGNINILTRIKKIRLLKLKNLFTTKEDINFNIIKIRMIVNKLLNLLDKENFLEVKLRLKMIKKVNKNSIDVKIYLENNKKKFIDKIEVKNKKDIILDETIIQRMKICQGELVNHAHLLSNKKQILGINSIKITNQEKKTTNISLKLKEIFTGLIKTSIGYQNRIGVTNILSLNEYNFLNKGKIIEVNLTRYKNNIDVEIKFNEPNFHKKCMLSIDWIYKYSKNREKKYDYIKERISVIKLGKNIKKKLYYDIKLSTKSKYIRKKIKEKYFLLGNSIYYEKVDNKASPNNGYILKLSQKISGENTSLGYIYSNFNFNIYKKVYKRIILVITNKIAYVKKIDEKYVMEEDKLFIKDEYIRGFEKSGIGPRMKNSKFSDNRKNLGGQKLFVSNIELLFPIKIISNLNIKGNIFADLGALYENRIDYNVCYNQNYRCKNKSKIDKFISFLPVCNRGGSFNLDYINNSKKIRFAIGLGISYNNNFGRIKIDYGIPIKKELFDNTSRIRFSIGTNLE